MWRHPEMFFNPEQLLQAVPRSTEVIWLMLAEVNLKRLRADRKAMNNEMVGLYNKAVMKAIKTSARSIIPWRMFPEHANMVADGIHFDDHSLEFSTEVI